MLTFSSILKVNANPCPEENAQSCISLNSSFFPLETFHPVVLMFLFSLSDYSFNRSISASLLNTHQLVHFHTASVASISVSINSFSLITFYCIFGEFVYPCIIKHPLIGLKWYHMREKCFWFWCVVCSTSRHCWFITEVAIVSCAMLIFNTLYGGDYTVDCSSTVAYYFTT